jgi:hypothetical protein
MDFHAGDLNRGGAMDFRDLKMLTTREDGQGIQARIIFDGHVLGRHQRYVGVE